MRTLSKSALLVLTLAVAVALPWLLSSATEPPQAPQELQPSETLGRVERRELTVRVRAIGELVPLRSTTISSEMPGDRGKIVMLVEDGVAVSRGDVLVRFDPTPFEEEKRQADLDVIKAEANLEARDQLLEWEKTQAEHRLETAKHDLKVTQLDLDKLTKGEGPLELARLEGELEDKEEEWEKQQGYLAELEGLVEGGYASAAEAEQVRQNAEKAKRTVEITRRQHSAYSEFILPTQKAKLEAEVERAEMEREQVRRSSGFKVAENQAALEKARRELDAARERVSSIARALELTEVRAPIDGMAVHREAYWGGDKRKPRVGDTVWQNQPLLFLPDLSQMLVRTRIREVDLYKIELGKTAIVGVDAYPEAALTATVHSIGVLAERRDDVAAGEKYFRVELAIDGEDRRLRPGMTTRVDILAQQVEDALTVPVQAIWDRAGHSYCYVPSLTGFDEYEVEVGVSNEHLAEILRGLSEGQLVSLVPPAPAEVNESVPLPPKADGSDE